MCVQAGELGGNVEALLMAVKATNDFEAEMARRFGGGQDGSEADQVRTHACKKRFQEAGKQRMKKSAAKLTRARTYFFGTVHMVSAG